MRSRNNYFYALCERFQIKKTPVHIASTFLLDVDWEGQPGDINIMYLEISKSF